jgi:hypothetical protein
MPWLYTGAVYPLALFKPKVEQCKILVVKCNIV